MLQISGSVLIAAGALAHIVVRCAAELNTAFRLSAERIANPKAVTLITPGLRIPEARWIVAGLVGLGIALLIGGIFKDVRWRRRPMVDEQAA